MTAREKAMEEYERLEGIRMQPLPNLEGNRFHWGDITKDRYPTAVKAWSVLWELIHGPGAWDRNDWVWRYEFEVVIR